MIKQIDISNFRSIKEQSIPLKKLNILYGPNGSGKSSACYAPYVFRNLFINPNQRLDSLFNFGFINLGTFENVVHKQESDDGGITMYIHLDISNYHPSKTIKKTPVNFFYELYISNEFPAEITFDWSDVSKTIEFDLPLNNLSWTDVDLGVAKLLWNGLTFEPKENTLDARIFCEAFNKAYEKIKNIELISVKRGFFNPIFSTEQANEESLFALQIREEGSNFESLIDHYFKQIFDKTFRFVAIPGSTSFYLRTQNKKGFTIDLVNEGFGINQSIYMLIKLLKKSTSLAFIEEPEIHLHPSAQNKLVDVFSEIIQKENKQIFLTTHSENIVSSVLNKIAKGELSTDDVQFYLAKVENDETKIIPQNVNEKGQIEGGLMSFMETELQNLKSLLGI